MKKLIGEILADLGHVSRPEVKKALERQREILEGKTLPDRLERSRLVAQARFTSMADSIPLLGQIFVDMGIVSQEDLGKALEQQASMIEKYQTLDVGALCSVMDMGAMVNSSLNLMVVLSMIMKSANNVTQSVASTLMLVEEDTGELVFSVPTGPKADELVDIRIEKGQGIAGWVAQHEQPVIVPDVTEDTRFFAGIDNMTDFKTESILAVPLKAKGKLIGVLEAINKKDGSEFSETDALLLTIFAEQAAMAIENARLYGELEAQLQETHRVKAELIEAEKSRALAQLSGGFAHDFNNIVNAIMGFSEIALLDMGNAEQVTDDIEEILKATNRAKELVDQILTFTRQTDVRKIPVQGDHVVKQAIKVFTSSLPSNIEIDQKLTGNGEMILADPSQIHQVLIHLFKNAMDAIGDRDGRLAAESMAVAIDAEKAEGYKDIEPGDYMRFCVSDNGCGMDDKTLEQIFEPYFTTKKKGFGTGMGLAAAHGIVRSHGGAITASSVPGEGSSFEILLPKARKVREEKPDLFALEDLPTGDEHILIVDDEASLLVVLEKMLTYHGYRVTAARSPQEALQMFQADPGNYDLVITDLAMPGIKGDKLAEYIMDVRPEARVILWTGFHEGIDEEKLKAIGIRAILTKPVIMSKLAIAVRRVLDEK